LNNIELESDGLAWWHQRGRRL